MTARGTGRAGRDGVPWSRKTSSNHGRHLRRLKEIGTVHFVQSRSEPNIIGLIDDALRMKRSSLQRRGAFSTAFSSLRIDGFLRAVAVDPMRPLPVRSSGLCLNGKPIAVDLSFECKGELLGFVLSYDEKYAKQGAGMVVACHSILSSFEEGYSRFDCLAPADPYKKRLTDRSIAVNSWATPLSIGGTVYSRLWLALLRPCARTIARILPRHAGLIASRVLAFFSKD